MPLALHNCQKIIPRIFGEFCDSRGVVGPGIILIFTLGNLLDPAVRPLIMGATFGIALALVIIAGSELFTGHTMFLTLGVKADTLSHDQL